GDPQRTLLPGRVSGVSSVAGVVQPAATLGAGRSVHRAAAGGAIAEIVRDAVVAILAVVALAVAAQTVRFAIGAASTGLTVLCAVVADLVASRVLERVVDVPVAAGVVGRAR